MNAMYKLVILISAFSLLQGCSMKSSPEELDWDCQIVQERCQHKYGMEVSHSEWEMRGRSGSVIQTQKNGVEICKHYEHGQLHGDVTYTFPYSGAIEKIEKYEGGALVRSVHHFGSGNKQSERVYHTPQAVSVISFFEVGGERSQEYFEAEKLIDGEYYTTSHQVEGRVINGEGIRVNRSSFGQIESKDQIRDGVLHTRVVVYSNEAPREVIAYLDGVIHGQKHVFTPSGEPISIEEWVDGKQHGITKTFQNGEKTSEIAYENGQKHGIEKRFRDGTHLIEEVTWRRGERHGPTTSYLGGVTRVDWYRDGVPVTKAQYKEKR